MKNSWASFFPLLRPNWKRQKKRSQLLPLHNKFTPRDREFDLFAKTFSRSSFPLPPHSALVRENCFSCCFCAPQKATESNSEDTPLRRHCETSGGGFFLFVCVCASERMRHAWQRVKWHCVYVCAIVYVCVNMCFLVRLQVRMKLFRRHGNNYFLLSSSYVKHLK